MVSLDVFRGITIAGMILVNDPGSWDHIYPPLKHAEWNGCTPTDLIFPFFLFIVGVSLTLSFESRLRRGVSRGRLAWHLLRRSAVLFGIGLLLNALDHVALDNSDPVRIMGVLQRIALCYLAAGLFYLLVSAGEADGARRRRQNLVFACAVATLLAGYWAVMVFVPVPGFGAGHLSPDSNLAAYIDRAILGNHLWSESKTWDPEGLLSTLPAIATALLGILAGEWIRSSRQEIRWGSLAGRGMRATAPLIKLTIAGAALVTAGLLLNPYFPINKNLWTSTFVLFTGGWAMLFLAFCHGVVDVLRWRKWATAFLVFGRNAILTYVLAELLAIICAAVEISDRAGESRSLQDWLYRGALVLFPKENNASLASAICFVLFILALIWPFDRRKLLLRI